MQVDDVRYKKLYKVENLRLAWSRILTSTNNLSYKNYYRRVFSLYQIDRDEKLNDLSNRLKEHIYQPSNSIKFFKPKESGLLRPFTFLELEDLIVYQGIANILLPDFHKKRRKMEYKYVFSNILCDDICNDIFLFKKWNDGYLKYKKNIAKNFENGFVYTAHFDLAAFYDSIDHNSLASAVTNNTETPFFNLLSNCLLKWANPITKANYRQIHHSIPQGPLASCVFAELFLLPLDEMLIENDILYSRYVDDIVIQGKSELEVRKAIAFLDKLCKHRGLIPQSSKFKILKAATKEEAIGKRPSIDADEKRKIFSSEKDVLKLFEESITEKTYDGATLRYILKCYRKSDILVPSILENFEKHYELTEEFCSYLSFFIYERTEDYVKKFRIQILNNLIPYDYVEKEIWELFAILNAIGIKDDELTDLAIEKIKDKSLEVRYGAFCYLSTLDDSRFMSFLQYENSSLMQLLLVRFITPQIIGANNFNHCLEQIKQRTSNVLMPIIKNQIKNLYLTGEIEENVYKTLNLTTLKNKAFDSFSYYLKNDYEIDALIDWEKVLTNNYAQLNELIYFISLYKTTDKTAWLNLVDTFNDLFLKTLIPNFEKWLPDKKEWPSITEERRGNTRQKEYGKILQELIDKEIIVEIARNLQEIHKRRCSTPLSHPKDYKTMRESKFLSSSERNKYFGVFKTCLTDIVKIILSYNNKQKTETFLQKQ